MTTPDDSVSAAFSHIRDVARKRFGKVPDLSHQGRATQPTRSAVRGSREGRETAASIRKRGRPTGPDGRALPKRCDYESLDSVLNREIQQRGWQRELAGGWVHSHWEDVVGARIAEHTTVEMLKGKSLFISCNSTAWATNLRMMQRQILQTITQKVGPNVVEELKIFGPSVPSWRKGPLHVKGRGPRDTYG